MAAAYSIDLRARVLNDSDVRLSSKELAERHRLSRVGRRTEAAAPRNWVDRAAAATRFRRRVLAEREEARLVALITAPRRCHLGGVTEGAADNGRAEHGLASDRANESVATAQLRPRVEFSP